MENLNEILEELQENIKLYEWETWEDIQEILVGAYKDYYIIYNNMFEITCLADIIMYRHYLASKKNKKFLLIKKRTFKKLERYIKVLNKQKKAEECIYIFKTLNKLYPGFDFYYLKKYNI